MSTIAPGLHSFAYAPHYLREQVVDVAAGEMVRQPAGVANHPMWVIGHITFSCQLLGEVVDVPPFLPADWAKRFAPGSKPVADASAYPSKEAVLAALDEGQSRLTCAVEKLTDAQLDVVFPEPSRRAVFPTVRHALTQVMIGHTSMHVGQITVWRRAMGLGPMKRSFE